MNNRPRVLFFVALLALTTSCGRRVIKGEGSIITKDRSITEFKILDLSAPITANIHVVPGASPSLKLTGYGNMLEHIKTKSEGNRLNIYSSKLIGFESDDITAEITVSSFDQLLIHGAAEAKVTGTLTGTDFELRTSGAGEVDIERLDMAEFSASVSGAGDVKVSSGAVQKASYTVSGAGSIDAFGLQVQDATARVSGAGDIEVNALRTLNADASGAGGIRYKGHPQLTSDVSGAGEVKNAN